MIECNDRKDSTSLDRQGRLTVEFGHYFTMWKHRESGIWRFFGREQPLRYPRQWFPSLWNGNKSAACTNRRVRIWIERGALFHGIVPKASCSLLQICIYKYTSEMSNLQSEGRTAVRPCVFASARKRGVSTGWTLWTEWTRWIKTPPKCDRQESLRWK